MRRKPAHRRRNHLRLVLDERMSALGRDHREGTSGRAREFSVVVERVRKERELQQLLEPVGSCIRAPGRSR